VIKIAVMQHCQTIVLILALAILEQSSSSPVGSKELGLQDELGNAIQLVDKYSHEAVKLLHDIFVQITKYQCSLAQEDCAAWQAVNMIEALELAKTNCDENMMDEMCVKAREFLRRSGRPASSHEMIRKGLLSVAEGISGADYKYLNAIRSAVIELICYKKSSACQSIRYLLFIFRILISFFIYLT
jgi:hypothetical protein